MMKNNRILLTGSKGQLGLHLQQQAKKTDFEIYAFDFDILDITKIESIEREFLKCQPSLIINCAAFTGIDKAECQPDAAYVVNEIGAENLARVAQRNNCRLFHISTDYVFDGDKQQPYTEYDVPNPLNVYGLSKLQGEQAVLRVFPQALILRTSWVFSSHGDNFVKKILSLGQEKNVVKVADDQQGAPTWAGHIADALLKLAALGNHVQAQGILHFTGWPYASWFDFAHSILTKAQTLGLYDTIPKLVAVNSASLDLKAQRPTFTCLDCSKIQALLPVLGNRWSDGLNKTLKELAISLSKSTD